jgi:hypothetical protein
MILTTALANATVLTETTEHPTWLPPFVFPIIAFLIFLFLGIVTWTYRDVANRHAPKAAAKANAEIEHEHGSPSQH